jgi:superfamily II DNA or RNA helicase
MSVSGTGITDVKLSELLAPDVPRAVRERGHEYFLQGRVRLLEVEPDEITAEVRGSENYEVWITFAGDGFGWFCDCPYGIEDNHVCKHVWATILFAESTGQLKLQPARQQRQRQPDWALRLEDIEQQARLESPRAEWPAARQILYEIDVQSSIAYGGLAITMYMQDRNAKGTGWNMRKELRLDGDQIGALPDTFDRQILGMLSGATTYYSYAGSVSPRLRMRWPLTAQILPLLARTGRCVVIDRNERGTYPLTWSGDEPWRFELQVEAQDRQVTIDGVFLRGEQRMGVQDATLVTRGIVLARGEAAALDDDAPIAWIGHLRQRGILVAPRSDADSLLARLLKSPAVPPMQLPEPLKFEVSSPPPERILQLAGGQGNASQLRADMLFSYGGEKFRADDRPVPRFDPERRVLFRRNAEAESEAQRELEEAGLRKPARLGEGWRIPARSLPSVVRKLLTSGWRVEAEGRLFRTPRSSRMEVASRLDWFELRGEVDYEGSSASLPEVLAAVRRGDHIVQLGDGSYGLLPEDWLARFGRLADFGDTTEHHVRFGRNQALLLDALLAAQPGIRVDEEFAHARQQIESFQGIRAAEQPPGFSGSLRDYQREGLGWMHFLRSFGFGGCLADDMGVGKTAQVLALLEERRIAQDRTGPSLAVVPRSLIFNWKAEAARFTPELRVLDHTGIDRDIGSLSEHDLILTTYGTLRRDILHLKEIEFDYVILDEAQAIRNAATDSAKAARLLRSKHRLALTGTPVENSLGDLWSIFEFLNPGMFGSGRAFDALAASTRSDAGEESRAIIARMLRPLILRRTKQQVARELPEKTEQTIVCELKTPQRKLYNELREYYRANLLKQIDRQGIAKSKIQVLEALLRLRQAACHPGLIDPKRTKDASAKVDLLLDRIAEVVAEGHKALVFSQFTSLLSIVRQRLNGMNYEYLDGKTRDRQARVERFQNDDECRLFLISLKAGGLGLNLTAAEYVFLLDPWWNPAVESQAIDRAHRIGQTQQVFAYRLIARDTVEEKVLELQKTKRDLAAAIMGEENRFVADLGREDLELLLS